MRKISKILLVSFIVLMFSFLCNFNLIASTTNTSDDGAYNYTTVNEEKKNLSNSVEYIKNTGYTTRSNKNYDQVTHIFSADMTGSEDVKIVTWAIKNSNNTGFTRNALLEIAKDYEKAHPGWIVLGGINSDQYYTKYGTGLGTDGSHYYYPQPYYPMISGGENWFSISPYASCNNVVGFKNDNSVNQMVYGNRSIASFKLHILDENGKVINSFAINDLNIMGQLGTNQTTVIAPCKEINNDAWQTVTKSSNNDFYVIENSDLSYVSNSTTYTGTITPGVNVNAFFGKGKISKIANSVSLTNNQFAIETTNPLVKEALSVGTYVRCEYEFDSGFDGIEEASGFHTVQRLNGQDQNVANSYNSRMYPRSIMGFDNTSGKVFLLTCEGKNSSPLSGLYAQEVNALCKQYNITDAFQQDGGGSVTSVYRDENGTLQYAQPPIESSYRSIACGLFIVLKVPSIEIEVEERYADKLVIKVDASKEETKYDKMYLEVGINNESKFYEVVNNQVTLTNLNSKTDYQYVLWLEKAGELRFKTLVQGEFSTCKITPAIEEVKYTEDEENIILQIKLDDPDEALLRLNAIINGKTYFVSVNDGIGIIKLDKKTYRILDLKFEIECVTLKDRENIEINEIYIDASVDMYAKHIVSSIEEFFDLILNK